MIYFKDSGIINAKQDCVGFLKHVFLQGFAWSALLGNGTCKELLYSMLKGITKSIRTVFCS